MNAFFVEAERSYGSLVWGPQPRADYFLRNLCDNSFFSWQIL